MRNTETFSIMKKAIEVTCMQMKHRHETKAKSVRDKERRKERERYIYLKEIIVLRTDTSKL